MPLLSEASVDPDEPKSTSPPLNWQGAKNWQGTKITPEIFAMALLVATSLQIMENIIPRIPVFPWMRLGLSYVIILPFLLHFGPWAALALLLGRNCIALLYGGQPMTTFLIGTGAGALTFLALGALVRWAYRRGLMGILGAGIVLATGFNLTQLVAVNLAFIQHSGFYFQTGPILVWSLISGTVVALFIRWSQVELTSLFATPAMSHGSRPTNTPTAIQNPWFFWGGLFLLVGLFFFSNFETQLPILVALMVVEQRRLSLLLHAWPFFFYLAWLHLFNTSGVYLWGEWITREGAIEFALYSIRLANLMLLGSWLSRRFPWQWLSGTRSPYLQGFLISLPMLSGLFKSSLEFGKEMVRQLFAGKRKGLLAPAFAIWKEKMEAEINR